MKRATRAAILAASGLALWSSTAGAQSIDKDADAERLFREAQKLMEERRFGEACPKFEAAYKKDLQLGTLLNLAYCHKEQGAVWQAWLEFKEAEVKATELKRMDRKDFARQRMAELEKSLARVVVEVEQKVDLIEVLVDDRRVFEAEKGQPFAAEPGQRKMTFRAKGKKQIVQLITIVKGDRQQRVTVPLMEDQPQEPPIVEAAPRPIDEPPPVRQAAEPKSSGSTQKTVAVVAAGVGLVGIGLGTIFGLQTLNNECTDGLPSQPNGPTPSCPQSVRDDASAKGAVSTVAFIGGGTLLVAGLVLWLSAPSGKAASAVDHRMRTARVLPEIGAGWAGVHGVF